MDDLKREVTKESNDEEDRGWYTVYITVVLYTALLILALALFSKSFNY
jgi:hypothetical protein